MEFWGLTNETGVKIHNQEGAMRGRGGPNYYEVFPTDIFQQMEFCLFRWVLAFNRSIRFL